MNNFLVSILIPCYNSEKYIKQTLLSCINQTYTNIEVIVVDDGSLDKSFDIVIRMSKEYPTIRVYKQNNKGAPTARNFAFEHSRGEYIQYLDADDILDTRKIEFQMKRLGSKDNTVVFGNCKLFYNNLENAFEYDPKVCKDYEKPKEFLIDLWTNATSIYPHSWLVPRTLVERVNGWDEDVMKNQDGVFFAKVVSASAKVFFEPYSLVYYRLENTNSISRKKSSRSEESRLKSFEEYEKLFIDDMLDEKVKKALAVQYSYFIFDNYPENKELCSMAQKKIESFGFTKPINLDIKLYTYLEPFVGIYGAIFIHKKLSQSKQALLKILKGRL